MISFLGEYEVAIDVKGRFLLPSAFRKQLPPEAGDKFVINRGAETCLTMYPMEVWNVLAEKINRLNDFNPKVRDFKRLFLNGATQVEVDSAGRVLIPKPLQEYAGIKKDMVFSTQGNKVELWDKDTHQNYMRQQAANFSALSEEVLGGGFVNPLDSI
jgi:MraZ protein